MRYDLYYKSGNMRSPRSCIVTGEGIFVDFSNLLLLGDGKGIDRIKKAREEIGENVNYQRIYSPNLAIIKEILWSPTTNEYE